MPLARRPRRSPRARRLHIQDLRDPNPATSAYLAACAEVGLEPKPHHNQDDAKARRTIVNQRRGRRWSSYDAYLKPAMRRDNLTVVSGAVADRVVVDEGRAVAVAYIDADGAPREIPAGRRGHPQPRGR